MTTPQAQRCLRAACVVVLLVASASQATATPFLSASVSDLPGGWFEYSYTLINPADSQESIFDLALFFDGEPLKVSVPTGWDHFEFFDPSTGLGSIDWLSPGPDSDLLPGQSLGGFAFASALGPGDVRFQIYSVDSRTDETFLSVDDRTIGPSSVPEPSTLWLLVTGVAGVWQARRYRRPKQHSQSAQSLGGPS